MGIFKATVAAAMLLSAVPASAAVTLVLDGSGNLTGAKGVAVGNRIYDVSFTEGTCAQVYGTCTRASFDFKSIFGAALAANALLDQVFIDVGTDRFDTRPNKTFGCTGSVICDTAIAYRFAAVGTGVRAVVASNRVLERLDGMYLANLDPSLNTSTSASSNFARFTLVSPGAIPEPATWMMFIGGFGLVGSVMRRKRTAIRFV